MDKGISVHRLVGETQASPSATEAASQVHQAVSPARTVTFKPRRPGKSPAERERGPRKRDSRLVLERQSI
jgi:hypothetical protein